MSVEMGMTTCSAFSLSPSVKRSFKGFASATVTCTLEYCDILVLINGYKIDVKTEDTSLAWDTIAFTWRIMSGKTMEQNVLKCTGRGLLSPCSYIYLNLIAFIMLHLPSRYVMNILPLTASKYDYWVWLHGLRHREASWFGVLWADRLRPWLAGLQTWGSKFCPVPQRMSSTSAPFSSDRAPSSCFTMWQSKLVFACRKAYCKSAETDGSNSQ